MGHGPGPGCGIWRARNLAVGSGARCCRCGQHPPREYRSILPGLPLDPAIRATTDLAELGDCDAWLVVTPAQHMRKVLTAAPPCFKPLILCSKGIEEASGEFLHEVARAVCPNSPVAVLSGPTFAHEVAAGLPTAVTVACDGCRRRRSDQRAHRAAAVPRLFERRCSRRRSRRRGQECAGDRLRGGRGQEARPERPRRGDRARLRRNDAVRPDLRGAGGNSRGAGWPGRPRPDLQLDQLAQFLLGQGRLAKAAPRRS